MSDTWVITNEWKERVLTLRKRKTEAEDIEFVDLVYEAAYACTPEVIDVLLQTFTEDPDYGVQESVVSVLSSADPEDYLRGILKHLPRLEEDAPSWAYDLMTGAVLFHTDTFVVIVNQADMVTRERVKAFIAQEQFLEDVSIAATIAAQI